MAEEGSPTQETVEGGQPEAPAGASVVDAAPKSDVPTWHEQLPESLRGNEALSQFAKIGELGEAFVSLKGEREGKVLVEGTVPESADKYELPKIEYPEGMQADEGTEKWFREIALKNNLTTAQAKGFREAWAQQTIVQHEAGKAAVKERAIKAENTLRGEYKEHYDENIALAKRVVAGRPGLAEALTEAQLQSNTELIKMIVDYGKAIGNAPMPGGSVSGGPDPRATDPRSPDAWSYPEMDKQ